MANICRGDALPVETPYLSLSHCWGTVKFLTTTRNNVHQFERSLPVEKLSRTFQDALFATINLGFQYVWIDSLCIVQDDADDWKRESVLMHKVYRNASCNISASGFAGGKVGFIPNKRTINPVPVFAQVEKQISPESAVQNSDESTYYLVRSDPWDEIKGGPLFRRGWTLQEQLLVGLSLQIVDAYELRIFG
ncbi:hypothetical protein N0V90_012220 [Kalmusia sp. IMI 367209]|nr:hypothetical protein N0V90_012220 [Kalmusia sp. IMI 367209]